MTAVPALDLLRASMGMGGPAALALAVSAQEWEAKYNALAAGIEDPALIANAEQLVRAAAELATTAGLPFAEVWPAMLEAIRLGRGRGTARFNLGGVR